MLGLKSGSTHTSLIHRYIISSTMVKEVSALSWINLFTMIVIAGANLLYWIVGFIVLASNSDIPRRILHLGAVQITYSVVFLGCGALAVWNAMAARHSPANADKNVRIRFMSAGLYFAIQSLASAGILTSVINLMVKFDTWNTYKEVSLPATPTTDQVLSYVAGSQIFHNYYLVVVVFTTIGVISLFQFFHSIKVADAGFAPKRTDSEALAKMRSMSGRRMASLSDPFLGSPVNAPYTGNGLGNGHYQ